MKNIQLTISPGNEASAHTVGIRLEGELLLKHLHEGIEEIKAAVKQYEHISLSLQNISQIDLACIQLLFSIKQSTHIANKKFSCTIELPLEVQNILNNAGMTDLALLLNINGPTA